MNQLGFLVLCCALALPAMAQKVPGVVIDYSPAASGIYIGSPGLAVLPNGDYVASHDEFGPKTTEHEKAITHIFRSSDKGQNMAQNCDNQRRLLVNAVRASRRTLFDRHR